MVEMTQWQNFSGGTVAKAMLPVPGNPGSILGQGARSHMLQLRPKAAKQIIISKKVNINELQ